LTSFTGGSSATSRSGDFRPRLLSGAILAGVALAAAFAGGWIAASAATLLVAIIGWEWARMTVSELPMAAVLVAAPGVVATLCAQADLPVAAIAIVVAGAIGAGIVLRSSWAAGGAIYAAVLGIALVALRKDPEFGLEALLFVFVVVWASDIAAYMAGRRFGGPKLWPRLSPKKTWSGFAAGTIAGIALGILVVALAKIPVTLTIAAVALLLSVVSVAGDLFESAVKRRFNRKDAGNLIPGHGGFLDRVDGLLFSATAAAAIGWLHVGWSGMGRGLLLW
jgi:phosphatidate cytidylyltransferase